MSTLGMGILSGSSTVVGRSKKTADFLLLSFLPLVLPDELMEKPPDVLLSTLLLSPAAAAAACSFCFCDAILSALKVLWVAVRDYLFVSMKCSARSIVMSLVVEWF